VGSIAFCRDFAKGIVAEVTEDLKVISRMTSLQAQHCLATGAVQHRINHLLRMIPGGEVADYGDIMEAYDNALLDLPRGMVRRLSLPDHAAGLVSLPLSSGGLGYRPWKSHADCAFLASYMHTAHHFPKLLPALAHRVPPILHDPGRRRNSRPRDGSACARVPVYYLVSSVVVVGVEDRPPLGDLGCARYFYQKW